MQTKLNQILESHQLAGGNQPVGAWKYADKEFGIDKYCAIFKTVGDMRLGTNLLQGLHKLIDKAIDDDKQSNEQVSQELESLFQAKFRFNAKDELIKPWQLKIQRSQKVGDIERDEETKRAWFVNTQTHTDWIKEEKTYTPEENARLFGIEDLD